jgi:hypothetical protein
VSPEYKSLYSLVNVKNELEIDINHGFETYYTRGKAIDYGKRGSKKKNRRIHEVLLGNFKPAILGKK